MLLKGLFFTGGVYFVSMACSHWVQLKLPLLYIYYDVPSTPYQDKIISFCAATYAIVFFQAARSPARGGLTAVLALAAAVAGLSAINLSEDLASQIGSKSTTPYWTQTGMIGGLLGVLSALVYRLPQLKMD